MLRDRLLAATVCAALAASAAWAQTPPAPEVAVQALAAPDLFSAGGRDTGLPPDLWRGTSRDILDAVLPVIAAKPLSPASRALARRVLATGAAAPDDIGRDSALAGQRVTALIAQGGVAEAAQILSKTSGLDRSPALAQAAVESALLQGDPDRACAVGDGLASGREEAYWLKLRAYCQLRRGEVGAAHLTFDLAQEQARDPTYGRLMGARLAGGGDPGKAALRNGLDYALSRDLGLDLAAATPSAAVAATLHPDAAAEAHWTVAPGTGAARAALTALAAGDLATAQTLRASLTEADLTAAGPFDLALLDAALAVASGQGLGPALDALAARGAAAEPKTRLRAQGAALLLAALGAPIGDRAAFAGFTAGDTKASPARALLLDRAAADHRVGETALLVLWISADAGPAGPASADRARIVGALHAVGLEMDARAFALEGLLK